MIKFEKVVKVIIVELITALISNVLYQMEGKAVEDYRQGQ